MVRAHEWDTSRRLSRAAGPRPWWTSTVPAAAPSIHLEQASAGDRVVVVVRGELDVHAAGRLETFATERALVGRRVLELDLAEVPWMGSAGLSTMVTIRRWCDMQGLALLLRDVQPSVWRVFELAGLDQVFTTEPPMGFLVRADDLVLF